MNTLTPTTANTLCRITAQYSENYGDSTNPHWKPKGGQDFEVMVDSDDFLYAEDTCIEAIKQLLQAESGNFSKYEYVSHELVFSTPHVFSSASFEAALKNVINQHA